MYQKVYISVNDFEFLFFNKLSPFFRPEFRKKIISVFKINSINKKCNWVEPEVYQRKI